MEVHPKVENKVHTLAKKKQDNYVTTQILCQMAFELSKDLNASNEFTSLMNLQKH